MRRTNSNKRFASKAIVVAISAMCAAGTANAMKIDTSDDWDVRFDNSLQWTMGWRAQSQDPKIANHPVFQSGDAKFSKAGDMVTNRLQDLIEFQGTYQQNMGFRMSASVWKDFAYTDHVAQNPLYKNAGFQQYNNDTYNNYTKHYFLQGGDWLDGFVFYNTKLGDTPVYTKLGRLTQYWGNAFFFGFSNIAYSQSPIDFDKAFTQPGSEVKELFLPRNQILVSADLTPDISVTGEYFVEYRQNLYPESGTYFGFFDVLYNGPVGACRGGNAFWVDAGVPLTLTNGAGPCGVGAGGLNLTNMGALSAPNNSHDYGLKLTWSNVPWVGGDMGFYYRQLAEVDPWPLINFSGAPLKVSARNTNQIVPFGSIYNVPAQGVKLFGISYEKTFGSISTGWELNTRRNTELQSSFVAGADGLGALGNITNFIGNTFIQLGTNKIGDFKLWDSGILLAEFSYTHLDSVTHNRDQATIVGQNIKVGWAGGAAGAPTCTLNNALGSTLPGSVHETCGTKNSFAVAALFIPQWQQVWPGVDLEAPMSYTAGLHGNPAYRAGSFYDEGSMIYSIGLRAIYLQKYSATLAYNGQYWRTGNTANTQSFLGGGAAYYAGYGGAGAPGVNDRGWVSLVLKTSF